MKVTAIIAFLLISLLFVLKECGNSELEKKIGEGKFPEYQAVETKDRSFKDREKEIALASYTEQAIKEEETPTAPVTIATSTPEEISPVKAPEPEATEIIEETLITEVEERVAPQKAQKAQEEQSIYHAISQEIQNQSIQRSNEKAALERKLETATRSEQLAQREVIDLREKRDALEKEITTMLAEQEKLYAKYTADREQDARALKELETNYKYLESNLTDARTQNAQLKSEIENVLAIAKEGTEKATQEQEKRAKAFALLEQQYMSLEANLSTQQEREQMLMDENHQMQLQITELNQTKAELEKTHHQQLSKIKALEAMIQEQSNYEANLTQQIKAAHTTNSDLRSEVATLLTMGKDITEKATLVQNEKNQEIQKLMGDKENMTQQLTQQQAQLEELDQLSKAHKQLEANLTAAQERYNELKNENQKLASEIAKLEVEKDELSQLSLKHENKAKEFEKLSTQYQTLEANLTANIAAQKELKASNQGLESKLNQLTTEKNELAKLSEQHQNRAQEFEKLSTEYKSLEANASAQREAQSKLSQENQALQSKIEELNQAITSCETQAKQTQQQLHDEKSQLEAQIKAQESQLSKEKAAVAAALLTAKNVESELKAHEEEKAKAAAEAKAKEEAKKELSSTFSLTHVAFKNNSMELTDASKALLNTAAEAIKAHSAFRYIIQGHTDNTGNQEYNIQLSKQRADAVKEYLVAQGVDASILSTEGFGPSQPIADNSTKEGRIQNRRVVFEIIDPSK